MKTYVLRSKDGTLYYDSAMSLDSLESMKMINHPIRVRILRLLKDEPMYPAEIAKKLRMHEQKVYYHIKQMTNAGILEIVERKEVRGTSAKKLSPKFMNFTFTIDPEWKELNELVKNKESLAARMLASFIKNGKLDADIVVGSPDPHGPHKARARDGHYAIELALFFGQFCKVADDFSVKLDVDINLQQSKNLIIVGGPVTNLVCSKINDFLPYKFSEKKPWGIVADSNVYTDDANGLVAIIPNPYNPRGRIMVIAGIRFIGTKSAVIGVTRGNVVSDDDFCSIVQGYDLDGDGKIDSVEIVERK